ncbi:four and a half LIM domains protein 2-like [Clytia hemisphaerica]|uniref:LIM zinc-binding domain-containing protein n=1 Tax=Clytia hemisphaerica TaxID=252671 RepID=A0A7M5X4J1_9CNID|eukprot:TCONS_00019285-protein
MNRGMNRRQMEDKCWKCFGMIQGEKVRYQEKQFCTRCYQCDGCKLSLKNKTCHEEGGQLYCKDCWNIIQQDKCYKCKTLIKVNGQKYRGKLYHEECFTCSACNCSLVGLKFHEDEGRYYCEGKCYQDLGAYVCNGCGMQIDGNDIEYMLFQGKYYHNRCFVCDGCRAPLIGQKFKISQGQRFCTRCR